MSEGKHPIHELMDVTMQKIRDMVDTNTIVGQPISTQEGITLIPVSKLSFGFASGGSDFMSKNRKPGDTNTFGGGSGAGVNITPVAFVVVKDGTVRMMTVDPPAASTVDRVIEMVPEVVDKVTDFIDKRKQGEDQDLE